MIITLDDYFRTPPANVPRMRKIASLAAEYGTNRVDNPDSVWSGIDYGGAIEEIRAIPGATLAMSAETQRISDRHAVGGDVTIADDGARIGVTMRLTREGLDLG